MNPPIQITLTIKEDEDIYPDLANTIQSERENTLLYWARMGKAVMRYAEVAPSKDSLNEFFSDNFKEFQETFTEHITGRMEELHDKIEEHKGLLTKAELVSSDRGIVAERLVETELSNTFADEGDTFFLWSTTGHQGDIIGSVANTDAKPKRVLIEVKNYTSDVPSHEVSKFEEDMRRHSEMDAGLFISVNHPRITGKRGLINIEEIDGRPVVYVAQEATGQKLFIVAWAMLRTLLDENIRMPALGMDRLAEMSAMRIKSELDAYKEYTQRDVERIETIKTQVSEIDKATEKIRIEAAILDNNIRVNSKSLGRFLLAEMLVLQGEATGNRQPVHWSEAAWENNWKQKETMTDEVWERHKANLAALNRWLNSFDNISADWSSNEKGVEIKQNGRERFTAVALATKLRFVFPKAVAERVNLQEVVEDSKSGITLKSNKEEGFEIDFPANRNMTIHPMILKVLKWNPEEDSVDPQAT